MRTASVYTHLRCNQRCSYCTYRRSADSPAFIDRAAVVARIDAALESGATEITVTGGEPTMRADLERLVAHARARGAERVVLETNATVVDDARARRLREAGLDHARVNVSAIGEASDRLTEDPGGFEATLRGMRSLDAAGVSLEVQAVVVASTRAELPKLPAFLCGLGLSRRPALTMVLPVESPSPGELLPYEVASAVVSEVVARATELGLRTKLSPATAPPPCVFPHVGPVAHLFSLTPGATAATSSVRIDACARCQIADRCGGFDPAYVKRFGTPEGNPITEDRFRRRLSLIASVDEQIARELVSRDRYVDPVAGVVEEDVVRVNFHCNQSCRFCFVSTHLPTAEDAMIRDAIVSTGRAGRRITLSGGEPTLNPALVDYVRLAKEHSALPVRIQTNAIRLASSDLARALVDAGLDEAFVSLHGSNPAIGDAITGAPGTYVKSQQGIDRLVALGVKVVVNFVICESNARDLPAFARLVCERWPTALLNVSFVAPSTDVVPREREFIPRYSDVVPHLAEALAHAREHGVEVVGFESMCGIPLCLVPDRLERLFPMATTSSGVDSGEFVKTAACARCDEAGRCHGLRRGYAALHGEDELRPITSSRSLP